MAYDEKLADRVRDLLAGEPGMDERKMFGGLCFTHYGHMCCGIVDDELMLRVGPQAYEATLALKHAREMDFTGRPLRGMVYVARDGLKTKRSLSGWVQRGLAFTGGQPPKKPKKVRPRRLPARERG